jgi:hypothetical protein
MLIVLLVLALLNASGGWHWHEHAHEPQQSTAAADAQDGAPEESDEADPCIECLVQAQQVAHLCDAPQQPAFLLPMHGRPLLAPPEQPPQTPPAGRVRVRDPPFPIA